MEWEAASKWQERWVAGAIDGCCDQNLAIVLLWRRTFDRGAFDCALADLFARHEALRTVLRDTEGVVQQGIANPGEIHVDEINLSRAVLSRPGALDRLTVQLIERPTHLIGGSLVHVALIEGPSEHLLVLKMHTAIADGWSLALLTAEFRALYLAYATDRVPPDWEPPGQARLHAMDQQALVTASAKRYWRGRLAPRDRRPLILGGTLGPGVHPASWIGAGRSRRETSTGLPRLPPMPASRFPPRCWSLQLRC